MTETIEGNKLIAEFMGKSVSDSLIEAGFSDEKNPIWWSEELKYHTSWDWLMPVVEKIKRFVMGNPIDVVSARLHGNINIQLMSVDINKVWQATTDFIQWYNTQSK